MSSNHVKWGYVKIMKLINLLRVHPVLWDDDIPLRTKSQKKLALILIAAQMDTTIQKVKRKIHTMRSQYTKEYRIMKTNPNYKPKWKLFDDFRFVFKHDKGVIDSKDIVKTDDDDTENSEHEDLEDLVTFSPEEHNNEHLHETAAKSNFGQLAENCKSNYKIGDDNDNTSTVQKNLHSTDIVSKSMPFLESSIPLKEPKSYYIADNTISKVQYNQDDRDEFSRFGENVARELRLLKDYQSIQLALKCKILRALVEANEALHRLGWIK